ncbi:hypothetical protein CYMTET_25240, partial [Cymbomonas tetramitiformis]
METRLKQWAPSLATSQKQQNRDIELLREFYDYDERAVVEAVLLRLAGGPCDFSQEAAGASVRFQDIGALQVLLHPFLFTALGGSVQMKSGAMRVDLTVHLRLLRFLEACLCSHARNREMACSAGATPLLLHLLVSLQEDTWPEVAVWNRRGGARARQGYQLEVAQFMARCLVEVLNHHSSRSDVCMLLAQLQQTKPSGWLQPLLLKVLGAAAGLPYGVAAAADADEDSIREGQP